jgi:subfamily B ATP-binding cassette protein MsbA
MTAAVALGVLVVSLLIRTAARRGQRLGAATVTSYGELYGRTLEILNGMRVVRLFNREAYEEQRFAATSERARRNALSVALVTTLIQPMTEVCYVLLFVGILVVWHGSIGVPTMLAFLALLYRMYPHVKVIDDRRVKIASLQPAIREVARLLDTRDKPYLRSGTRTWRGLETAITCRRVSFDYGRGDGHRALVDVSCRFAKNQLTAVVGGSGAGKSTLISLLCRLYDRAMGRSWSTACRCPSSTSRPGGDASPSPARTPSCSATACSRTSPTAGPRPTARWWSRPPAGPMRMISSWPCPRATRPGSASAACGCRRGSGNGSPSPGRSCAIPRS